MGNRTVPEWVPPTREQQQGRRRAALLAALRALHGAGDTEWQHMEADRLILDYLDDAEIAEAWAPVPKWYA